MFRWMISTFCLLLFCFMLVMAVQSHHQVQNTREKIVGLENRKAELQRWDAEHQTLQDRAKQWNQLWGRAVEAGLEPAKWQFYPVNIEDTFLLHEAESILRILSSNMNNKDNFWFTPGFIQISPLILSEDSHEQKRSAVEMHVQGKIMTISPDYQ